MDGGTAEALDSAALFCGFERVPFGGRRIVLRVRLKIRRGRIGKPVPYRKRPEGVQSAFITTAERGFPDALQFNHLSVFFPGPAVLLRPFPAKIEIAEAHS